MNRRPLEDKIGYVQDLFWAVVVVGGAYFWILLLAEHWK